MTTDPADDGGTEDGRTDDGRTDEGRGVLTLGSGPVRLEVMPHGARVHRLLVATRTGVRNVVLGHPSVAAYAAAGDFMGATVGRYANRIAGARFRLGERSYRLSANENGNCLHGGADGFSARVWELVEAGPDRVGFALLSPADDQGFPGALAARAEYRVTGSQVRIELTATCDAPTVVNLTNHAYFNLAGDGTGTVDGHRLTVPADLYTPVSAELLPTGELAPVDDTPFDFRTPTRLGPAIRSAHPQVRRAGGIDHNLVPRGTGLRAVARLEVDDLAMVLSSDAPGLQVYTGNFLGRPAAGPGGSRHRQGDGLCLEPQAHPDTPNRPQFGSALLRPGETYRHSIRWSFEPAG